MKLASPSSWHPPTDCAEAAAGTSSKAIAVANAPNITFFNVNLLPLWLHAVIDRGRPDSPGRPAAMMEARPCSARGSIPDFGYLKHGIPGPPQVFQPRRLRRKLRSLNGFVSRGFKRRRQAPEELADR